MSYFHSKEGWFFRRFADGSVQVDKCVSPDPKSDRITSVNFTPDEWASIVAFVSQYGDEQPAFDEALTFHGKP